MNKKEIFITLKKAANEIGELSQLQLNKEEFVLINQAYNDLFNKMVSVLGNEYEWHFNHCYDNEITITIYDYLEVSIYIYEEDNGFYCEATIYNPFTECFEPFNLSFEKSLQKLMVGIYKLKENGEIKKIKDYVELMNEAREKYEGFKNKLIKEVGSSFEDVDYLSLESEIIRKLLGLS